MKPKGFDNLTADEKRAVAHDLLNSMRGRYIMAQALTVAIGSMESDPIKLREVSNIQDMQILLDGLFPQMAAVASMQRESSVKLRAKIEAKRAGK